MRPPYRRFGLGFELDQETDTYFVSGYEPYGVEAEVRIPSKYQGKAVTAIRNKAFMGCPEISSVIIPDSITLIDIYAFENCTALEHVTLGAGVKTIGMSAFANCSALTSVTFPEGLETIGDSAFENTAITSFSVTRNVREIGMYAFRTKELKRVTFDVVAGWKTYPILSDAGTPVDVSDPAANAEKLSKAQFLGGLANYVWRRG